MNNKKYFTSKLIIETHIESNPETDFVGYNNNYDNLVTIGDKVYELSDSGLVNIDSLIIKLNKLKENGSNYVSCDWHCDHGEYDLYGFEFRLSSQEEIDEYVNKLKNKQKTSTQEEITRLEERLANLKTQL